MVHIPAGILHWPTDAKTMPDSFTLAMRLVMQLADAGSGRHWV